MSTWRLIISEPATGTWNMALDEALLESCCAHTSISTLRFYSWEPTCLSLGYAQPSADVDREALMRKGWDLVRRPTGGKAILHTDELTYSITASIDEPLVQGSVLESYCRLSVALLAGLSNLGIHALATRKKEGQVRESKPVCFETPSDYEITVDGKKIIGSAQARRAKGVLQHGAIPTKGDLTRINQVLHFEHKNERRGANERLNSHATTIAEYLGHEISFLFVQKAFEDGFRTTFNIDFLANGPTEKEIARAGELMRIKYANPDWTCRI